MIIINCDNEGAIFLSKNQESRKTKYLDTRIHFVRDFVEDGIIMVKFVRSDENLSDPYTKNVKQRSLIKNTRTSPHRAWWGIGYIGTYGPLLIDVPAIVLQ